MTVLTLCVLKQKSVWKKKSLKYYLRFQALRAGTQLPCKSRGHQQWRCSRGNLVQHWGSSLMYTSEGVWARWLEKPLLNKDMELYSLNDQWKFFWYRFCSNSLINIILISLKVDIVCHPIFLMLIKSFLTQRSNIQDYANISLLFSA